MSLRYDCRGRQIKGYYGSAPAKRFIPAVSHVYCISLSLIHILQGGQVSPVLANVYLHYTLDTWFDYVKKHGFKGEMYMVRYADDFVCLFQYENEARKFYQLLIERLKKFGLEIAEDKSRILPLSLIHI